MGGEGIGFAGVAGGASGEARAGAATATATGAALWESPFGVGVLDRELRFLRVNPALAAMSGVAVEAHSGRTMLEAYGDQGVVVEAVRIAHAAVAEVASTGEPRMNVPLSTRFPDGTKREWLASYLPVAGRGDAAVVAVVADVTAACARDDLLRRERAEAEGAARRLALLQQVTSDLSAARTAGEVGRVLVERGGAALGAVSAVVFSERERELSLLAAAGLAAAELPALDHEQLGAPLPAAIAARTGAPLWLETDRAVQACFEPVPQLGPYAAKLGALAAAPLVSGGAVIGAVAFAFSAPRRFEPEERELVLAIAAQCALALERAQRFDLERAARAEVEESRGLLDGILENAPLGIALFDRDLRFVRVNPVLATMDGLSPGEHVGRRVRDILPGLPVDELEAAWREVLRTGRPLLDVEVRGETPAEPGRRRTFLESWYPVRAGGGVMGIGALVREVTREREAEEFQRHVLGIVGHDLRNPLSAISTSAQLLRRAAGEGSTPTARLADRILANGERMARIVSVLADFARIRAGQPMPVRRMPGELGAICRAVAEECEASHPGRTVAVEVEGDTSGAWDADRIAQVIANLIGNALDYSPAGTAVGLACRPDGEGVLARVENHGNPIPPEILPVIFEPFRRGERERPGGKDSLGLGLFIARAIATAHGGRIEVESPPGGPTAFTVRLPRQ